MKVQDLRVYPLRMTKRKWKIPIYVRHECSEKCSKIFVLNDNFEDENSAYFSFQENPDYENGKCSNYGKLEHGFVVPALFSKDAPCGADGPLYNPDEVVIPDQVIEIDIDFPLSRPITMKADFGHSRISRKELLFAISIMYKYIYEVEERTSPSMTYAIVKDCEACIGKSAYDYVITISQKEGDCSICLQNYGKKKVVKLPCQHMFHDKCIKIWLRDEHNNSCPLCRDFVLKCKECEGEQCAYEYHESVVIPIEHRGAVLNRNPTFGLFGIYGHDLEDLFLYNMYYDRINKKLCLGIST